MKNREEIVKELVEMNQVYCDIHNELFNDSKSDDSPLSYIASQFKNKIENKKKDVDSGIYSEGMMKHSAVGVEHVMNRFGCESPYVADAALMEIETYFFNSFYDFHKYLQEINRITGKMFPNTNEAYNYILYSATESECIEYIDMWRRLSVGPLEKLGKYLLVPSGSLDEFISSRLTVGSTSIRHSLSKSNKNYTGSAEMSFKTDDILKELLGGEEEREDESKEE